MPAVLTTVGVALHKVDADELSGLCLIGAAGVQSSRLVELVVVPLSVCLVVGVGFQAAGLAAVCRIRRALSADRGGVERLDGLMVKMAVFSGLYAATLAAVVASLVYEQRAAPAWHRRARTAPCAPPDGLDRCPLDESIPPLEVYLVRALAALMPGMATGVWIWSAKTLRSWRRRVFCCCRPAADRRGSTARAPRTRSTGRYAAVQTGGRLVRWSTGLKDAPNSAPCVSTSARNDHCYTIS